MITIIRKTLIPVIGLFALTMLCAGCHSEAEDKKDTSKAEYKIHINEVLKQDKCSDECSSVAEYSARQRRISLKGCPKDFREAYRKHQDAWSEMATVEQEAKEFKANYDSTSAYVEAFLRGLVFDFSMTGEAKAALQNVQEHHRQASKKIRDTYKDVLDIAESYDVDVSQYR